MSNRSGARRANRFGPLPLLLLHLLGAGAVISLAQPAPPPDAHPVLSKWLDHQAKLQTWSAEFTQTRSLKALAAPLTSRGRVWFSAPDRFRWELGTPPQTIVVREPEQMTVIYPNLKRAERYPLRGTQPGPWRDVLALLDAGFPRNKEDLRKQFRVTSLNLDNGLAELTLQPDSPAARRMIPRIKIGFETNQFTLHSTELHFADGSILRNEFTNSLVNPRLDPALFEIQLAADYTVAEPLKRPSTR